MASLKDIISGLEQQLTSNPPKGTTAVFQFNLTGDDGGSYYLDLKNDSASVIEGTSEKANVVITMSAGDFKDMVDGKLNTTTAYLTGRIKISGDMGLVMKLRTMLA